MGFIGKIVSWVFRAFEGKLAYQRLFERLHELSLRGMNFGRGDEIEHSGELEVMRYVFSQRKNENRQIVIFDVGANIGKYTLALLSAMPNRDLMVYAFEPSLHTYERLTANVQKRNTVLTFNVGLSDVNTTQVLHTDKELSGLASIYRRKLESRNIVMDKVETITLRRLDDFCREHKIGEVDFLKLDVEGHELFALRGAAEMMRKGKIRFIQFEFGGCNIDSRTYFKDFYELLDGKYALYRIVKDGIYPVREYKESDEVFTTTNYFAELRERQAR